MNKKALITLLILFLTSNVFASQKTDLFKSAYMAGDYTTTYKLCIEALKEDYSNADAHYYLGLYYMAKDNLNDAKAQFKYVIELAPGSKLASYSTMGIQNIYDEQNKTFRAENVQIASNSKKSNSYRKSASKRKKSSKNKPAKVNVGSGDNYYFNAVNNNGEIVRWDANYPINIYIPQKDYGYTDAIKRAFSAWNQAYSGFKFEYVASTKRANIIIYFKDKLVQNTDKYDKGGYAKPVVSKGLLRRVEIYSEVKEADGSAKHSAKFYNVMVHEIGHSLGIWGHSDKKEDVMYPIGMSSVREFNLSQRDINTVRALYKNDADITNRKRLKENDTVLSHDKKLKETSKRVKIAEAKKYVALMPDNPENWVKLGYTYETYGEPQRALDSYAKALRRDPKNLNATKNIAYVYFNMKKYPNAIQAYKSAIKLEPENIDLYYNIALCYINLGKDSDARHWINEAIKQNPKASKNKDIAGLIKYLDKKQAFKN